jgi:hypothetical protein
VIVKRAIKNYPKKVVLLTLTLKLVFSSARLLLDLYRIYNVVDVLSSQFLIVFIYVSIYIL